MWPSIRVFEESALSHFSSSICDYETKETCLMELMALCVASLNDQSPFFECVLGGGGGLDGSGDCGGFFKATTNGREKTG